MPTATEQAEDHKTDVASSSGEVQPQRLLEMLGRMMLIRRFEERTMQSYQQAKIGGFCHIYAGQEAVAVGAMFALREDDPIVTAYRDHGYALARGMAPQYAMAEMYGKVTGCSKGKGGSMHMFDKPHHMFGGHAIVGGQTPLATGLGFAVQYNQQDKVVLCFLGDGALNQGSFHESMNLAGIWNLPIIFVCENNMYSMGTHIARGTTMADDLEAKAQAYGMRYAECDGQDVISVHQTFEREISKTRSAANPQWDQRREVLDYRREGHTPGPCFLVAQTYRYQGHSMSDPQKYRSKEEVSEFKQQDAIEHLTSHLLEKDLVTQDRVDELDQQAKDAAREAVTYARESEELGPDEMYTDVYAEPFGRYQSAGPSVFLKETGEQP